MNAPIRGKVARIMNSRELVINKGSNDGVEVGMRFMIIDRTGENITDPDTGKIIGSLQKPKVEVEVTQIGELIAVAHTYKYRMTNVGGMGFGGAGQIAKMFSPPKFKREYETLKSDDQDWEPLSEEDSYIQVGDPVVQITFGEDIESPGGIIASESGPEIEAPSSDE